MVSACEQQCACSQAPAAQRPCVMQTQARARRYHLKLTRVQAQLCAPPRCQPGLSLSAAAGLTSCTACGSTTMQSTSLWELSCPTPAAESLCSTQTSASTAIPQQAACMRRPAVNLTTGSAGIAPEHCQKLETLIRLYGLLGEEQRRDWTHRCLHAHTLSFEEGALPQRFVLAGKVGDTKTCCCCSAGLHSHLIMADVCRISTVGSCWPATEASCAQAFRQEQQLQSMSCWLLPTPQGQVSRCRSRPTCSEAQL